MKYEHEIIVQFQSLFNHFRNEHNLILTTSEMQEIISECKKVVCFDYANLFVGDSMEERIEKLAIEIEKRYNECHFWKRGRIYADGFRNGANTFLEVMGEPQKPQLDIPDVLIRSYTPQEVRELFNKLEAERAKYYAEDANDIVPLEEWLVENEL